MSAKSAHQILSIKDECTFGFSSFLINGLWNSLGDSLFRLISFLTGSPKVLFTKKILKLDLLDIHHIYFFNNIKCPIA